jgi:hypothetical protein
VPAERKTPPPCPHEQEFGENTVWPDDVSLEHFDKCLTPEGRLWVWTGARKMADTGSRCIMSDHATATRRVQALLQDRSLLMQAAHTDQAYISTMVEQLRELVVYIDQPEALPTDMLYEIRERIRGILGTRAQSAEQVEP